MLFEVRTANKTTTTIMHCYKNSGLFNCLFFLCNVNLPTHLPCTFCMYLLSDTPNSGLAVSTKSWWVKSGVSDKRDIENVQGRGAWRTDLKTTDLVSKKNI